MDATNSEQAIPAKKTAGRKVVRANLQQLVILRDAFAQSPLPPVNQALQNLANTTGLTEQWITGWFGRERKKYTKNTKVAELKAEHQDAILAVNGNNPSSMPMPSDSEATATDNTVNQSSAGPPKKKARTARSRRPQTRAAKKETLEATLPLDPTPVPTEQVPCNPVIPGAVMNPLDQPHIPASEPVQQVKRRRGRKPAAIPNTVATTSAADSENTFTVPQANQTIPETVQSVPLPRPNTYVSPAQFGQSSFTPNPPPPAPLLSIPLLPVLTLYPQVEPKPQSVIPSREGTYPPLQFRYPLATIPPPRSQPQPQPQPQDLPTNPVRDVLNPNFTPMKHLTVLNNKLADGSVSLRSRHGVEDLMSTLLDDQLAEEDPFQTAMGLVFIARSREAARAVRKA
ncbi:hypothetical protein V5O48_003216 [Marasmius crinis-equi]|uniref:Homeobox domain-containing protein n=1 Tax=Marasmius crinis-equi TaxID=585013 RepID=A0ABR3FTK8_9AGAR